MIKGLTKRAQKVLSVLAREEARKYKAEKLLSEHIVLALLREPNGIAFQCLGKLGINPEDMAEAVVRDLPKNQIPFNKKGDIPASGRVKMLLETAANEASAFNTESLESVL